MAYITAMDKLTVEKIDKAIDSFDKRLKQPKISNGLRKKLERMKADYTKQKQKTLNLYHKNKKDSRIRGLNVSLASVEKILELKGKKTTSFKNDLFNKLAQHPIENAALAVGAGLGLGAVLAFNEAMIGKALLTAAEAVFKAMTFQSGAAIFFGAWAGTFVAAPLVIKAIRKYRERNAIERQITEEAMNADSAHNFENLDKKFAEKRASLIEEAVMDEETRNYLQDVASNPKNTLTVRKNAAEILEAAKKQIIENKKEEHKSKIISQLSQSEKRDDIEREFEEYQALLKHMAVEKSYCEKLNKDKYIITNNNSNLSQLETDYNTIIEEIANLNLSSQITVNGAQKTLDDSNVPIIEQALIKQYKLQNPAPLTPENKRLHAELQNKIKDAIVEQINYVKEAYTPEYAKAQKMIEGYTKEGNKYTDDKTGIEYNAVSKEDRESSIATYVNEVLGRSGDGNTLSFEEIKQMYGTDFMSEVLNKIKAEKEFQQYK